MDTHLATLKEYIKAQRQNGISDEAISNALVSAGWHQELVVKAFATDVAAGTSLVPPVSGGELHVQSGANDKNRKKVKIVGITVIVLGILSMFTVDNQFQSMKVFIIGFAIAQILIGVGVLRYNKIAYTIFNILAILVIIASIFLLPSLQYAAYLFMFNPTLLSVVLGIVDVLVTIAQPVLFIYGGILFHKKEVRALFGTGRK